MQKTNVGMNMCGGSFFVFFILDRARAHTHTHTYTQISRVNAMHCHVQLACRICPVTLLKLIGLLCYFSEALQEKELGVMQHHVHLCDRTAGHEVG